MTMLSSDPSIKVLAAPRATRETHIFSIADADDVLPKRRNHGLKPSDDLAEMIRQCYLQE